MFNFEWVILDLGCGGAGDGDALGGGEVGWSEREGIWRWRFREEDGELGFEGEESEMRLPFPLWRLKE